MANRSSQIRSGRRNRPDLIDQIGPASAPSLGDPVAVMPALASAATAPIQRIEGVRVIRPAMDWLGVGLRLQHDELASSLFEIFLTAGGGRDLVIAVLDEDDAIAVWRSAGKATALPLLLQAANGTLSNPYPQIGPIALGPLHVRRQHSFLRHRRPRFLMRRKSVRPRLETIEVFGHELSRGGVL
ncbi:MAG: DUF6101 family protein [Hyphomicrobiales bacterium]|jgi:hypothetical protein|nr:DUF6101 family protein [Hyphomicrobiales bacterium]